MKRTLLLSLSLLVTGTAIVPSRTQALSEKQTAALVTLSGPAVFGLYKLGTFIKSNAAAKKVAKYVGKGLGTLVCASTAIHYATSVASTIALAQNYKNLAAQLPAYLDNHIIFNNRAYEFTNDSYFNATGSLVFGLAACLFAQSLVNDVKADTNS